MDVLVSINISGKEYSIADISIHGLLVDWRKLILVNIKMSLGGTKKWQIVASKKVGLFPK